MKYILLIGFTSLLFVSDIFGQQLSPTKSDEQSIELISYKVDKVHSSVAFKVGHLMVSKVKGTFDDFSGSFELSKSGTPVSMEGLVSVKSVNTRNEKRDDHLRNSDFFDADNYPEMKFKSTSIKSNGDRLLVNGNLTLRGVTRPLTLTGSMTSPVTAWGKTLFGVSLGGTLNRENFGMTWNKLLEAGGVVVGKEVELDLEFELIQQKSL